MAKKRKKKWIQGIDLKKGRLRRKAGVKEGEKIPVRLLRQWAKSKDESLAKAARLALKFRGWSGKKSE